MMWVELYYFPWKLQPLWHLCELSIVMYGDGDKRSEFILQNSHSKLWSSNFVLHDPLVTSFLHPCLVPSWSHRNFKRAWLYAQGTSALLFKLPPCKCLCRCLQDPLLEFAAGLLSFLWALLIKAMQFHLPQAVSLQK